MKKSLIIIIIVVILGGIGWYLSQNNGATSNDTDAMASSTTSAAVSETKKVNDSLSEFKNEELGFSVKYPSAWEKTAADTGVMFNILPTGKASTNTLGKLEAQIQVTSGKCAFPPVTTIKDRGTLKSGDLNFNMISMSNSVKGYNYFDRMYSLQNNNVCYIFSFSSVSVDPASKGYKGSEATQMTNNNKALVDSADSAFTAMVKSFAYVIGPAGQDETQVNPAKH